MKRSRPSTTCWLRGTMGNFPRRKGDESRSMRDQFVSRFVHINLGAILIYDHVDESFL